MMGQPHNPRLSIARAVRGFAPLAVCATTLAGSACDLGDAAHATGQVANRIESTVVSGAETLKAATAAAQERLGLAPPETKKIATRPARRGTGRRLRRPPGLSGDSHTAAESPPHPVLIDTSPQEVLEPGPPVSPSPSSSDDSTADHAAPTLVEDVTIYSHADTDVAPPRFLRAQDSTPALPGAVSSSRIELVISAHGAVESARLTSAPRRLTDAQVLSTTKNWVFEPARRYGVAVRYRLTIDWNARP